MTLSHGYVHKGDSPNAKAGVALSQSTFLLLRYLFTAAYTLEIHNQINGCCQICFFNTGWNF